jgi:hypothetical protein
MMHENRGFSVEESAERLKITLPVQRNLAAAALYTLLSSVWFGVLLLFLYWLFFPPTSRGMGDLPFTIRAVWFVGVLIWLYVWVRYLGRTILRWWQYHLATRELLFIEPTLVMVRRPVSIFGLTDAYARAHMGPVYYSEKHNALAFPYGKVQHILFAHALPAADSKALQALLNGLLFPDLADDDDED